MLEIRDRLRLIAPTKKRAPLFRDFALAWFESYAKRQKKPSTLRLRRYYLNAFLLPTLGKLRLDAIRGDEVEALRTACGGLYVGTTNQILGQLTMILREAEDEGLIETLPRIRLTAVVRVRPKVHEVDAYLRVVASARRLGWRHLLAALLAGDAGMRASECAALSWPSVDLDARTIDIHWQDYRGELIRPKGNDSRTVRMTEALYEALSARKRRKGRVLIGKRGKPIRRGLISAWVDEATAAAGIDAPGGAHFLRHVWCSHLAASGAVVSAIQEMGGWKHLSTMQVYLHATEQSTEDAMRMLDAKRKRRKVRR